MDPLTIDLSGRVALVTGGSRGIGRAITGILARAGARVAIGYERDGEAATELVGHLRSAGREAMAVAGDVARTDQARGLIDEVVRAWGRLDILVNNAGIWQEDAAGGGNADVWDQTFAVNARGAYLVTDAAVAHLARSGGAVVFVSSTAAQRGEAGHSAYAASKAALIAYAKSLAVELGPRGVRVNCVAPGWVDTDMTRKALTDPAGRLEIERSIPVGRIGKPDDVAGPVLFLVSDLARYVHGEVVNVNGGSVLAG